MASLCTLSELEGRPPNLVQLREHGVRIKHAAVWVNCEDVARVPGGQRLLRSDNKLCTGEVHGQRLVQHPNSPSHGLGVEGRNDEEQQQEADVGRQPDVLGSRAKIVGQVHEAEVRQSGERQHVVENHDHNSSDRRRVRCREVVHLRTQIITRRFALFLHLPPSRNRRITI
jgi:hypothetical protein